ncbi:MAG: ATP-binding protein [Gemmatimonadaceae bacterium]
MNSIRARLTIAYAAALIGTMIAFAAVLLVARKGGSYNELTSHVATEANLVLTIIRQAEAAGQPVTVTKDPVVGATITPTLRTLLEIIPDYVIVLDTSGRNLYISNAVRQLDDEERFQLQIETMSAPTKNVAKVVSIGGNRLLLVASATNDTHSSISRVAVALTTQDADLAVRELVGTMLITLPLLIVASIVIAYALAGRAFRPVDSIIDEVKAITDGRSLHRRLPLLEEAGDELGRLSITLNEMIERLETSFAAMRRFTADASHELKTPLTVLRADVERAMSPTAARGEKLIALEEALHEVARMSDLVESLLTLARADEGRFDLHREPVALEPLVRDVLETATILGENARVAVSMPMLEPGTVLGDYVRLRQLFLNLVTNAIKYTPRGGSVEIKLMNQEGIATLSVRDTGIGISAADLPHVFERFYRADRARSRTSERGGFGLGLAISQWIVEAHGGTIAVRSRLARGSTFTVTMPVLDPAAAPMPETSAEPAA